MENLDMKETKGMNIHARRVISYVVLVILTILCLIWFYILFLYKTISYTEICFKLSWIILLKTFVQKFHNDMIDSYTKVSKSISSSTCCGKTFPGIYLR